MGNIKDFIKYIKEDSNKNPDSLKFIKTVYSKKYGQIVCLTQLVGKNIFPKYPPHEILADKSLLNAFSREDLLRIRDIEYLIQKTKDTHTLLELDENGTALLRDNNNGETKRHAISLISRDKKILSSLPSVDAHDIGYRSGYIDCDKEHKARAQLKKKNSKLRKLINLTK